MIPIVHLPQDIEKHVSILIVLKDGPPRIPSGGDMIDCLRVLDPQWSRHRMLLYHFQTNVNIQDLTPMLNPVTR